MNLKETQRGNVARIQLAQDSGQVTYEDGDKPTTQGARLLEHLAIKGYLRIFLNHLSNQLLLANGTAHRNSTGNHFFRIISPHFFSPILLSLSYLYLVPLLSLKKTNQLTSAFLRQHSFAHTSHLCESYYLVERHNTGCPRRNVKYFGRVFLMLNYTDITQNTYIQS